MDLKETELQGVDCIQTMQLRQPRDALINMVRNQRDKWNMQ